MSLRVQLRRGQSARRAGAAGALQPPVNTVPPVIIGLARVGEELTVSNGGWTNSPTGFEFQWRRGGVAIAGATAGTYVLQPADEAGQISVLVTASNAAGSGLALTSDAGPVAPAAVAPANITVPVITGTAQQGQTLTATAGTWSGEPTSFAYQWRRAGTNIAGATASSYVLVAGDVGNTITVRVTASNAAGSAQATSAATGTVSAAAVAPVNTAVPTITGTAQQGQTLTATNGTWNNSPTGFAYQWRRAGVDIAGATAQTYVPVSGDVGSTLTVRVTASNAAGSASATSAATATVTSGAGLPTNTALPTITGTQQETYVLTATNGTWTGSPSSFAYQWRRDGVAIAGATAQTYTLAADDVDRLITVQVTATNGSGSASATSAATGRILFEFELVTETGSTTITDIPNLRISVSSGSTPLTIADFNTATGSNLVIARHPDGDKINITGFASQAVRDAARIVYERGPSGFEPNAAYDQFVGLAVRPLNWAPVNAVALPGASFVATTAAGQSIGV